MNQIKDTFDTITKNKIMRGAFHTFLTSALLAGTLSLLNYLGQQDYGNPLITMVVSQIAGVLYNIVKEYKKGE